MGEGAEQVTKGPKTRENLPLKVDRDTKHRAWGENFAVSGPTERPRSLEPPPWGREGTGHT